MSEANRVLNTNMSDQPVEDPLAELARIVSGDANTNIAPQQVEPNDSLANDAGGDDFGMDLESELLRELDGEQSAPVDSTPSETQPMPAMVVEPKQAEPSFEDQLLNELSVSPTEPETTLEENTSPLDEQMRADLQIAEQAVAASSVEKNIEEEQNPQNRLAVEEVSVSKIESVTSNFNDEYLSETSENQPVVSTGNAEVESALDDIFAQGFADELATQDLEVAQPQEVISEVDVDELQLEQAIQESITLEASTPEVNAEPNQVEDLGAAFTQSVFELERNNLDDLSKPSESQFDLDQQFEDAFAADPSFSDSASTPNEVEQFQQPEQTDFIASQFEQTAPINDPVNSTVSDPVMEAAFADPGSLAVDDIEHPAQSENTTSLKSGGVKLALGALAISLLAGLAIVAWGAMNDNATTDEASVPIIAAETSPTKVKPQDPGGKKIANTENKVYENVTGKSETKTTQEKLITSRPNNSNIEPKNVSRLEPNANTGTSNNLGGVSPKRVKTLTIKPDGSIVRASEPERVIASIKPTQAIKSQELLNTKTTTTTLKSSSGPAVLKPIAPSVQKTITAKPKSVAVPVARPSTAKQATTNNSSNAPTSIAALPKASVSNTAAKLPSGGYSVQVSSQRSDAAAKASYANIKKRFASVLGNKQAAIQRATVEGKGTFYRVKIPAVSKAEANKLCSRLKSAGGSCFVSR